MHSIPLPCRAEGARSGALADLEGDGQAVDSSLSDALQHIATGGNHLLPTALIAGIYSDFAGVQSNVFGIAPFLKCGGSDPLARMLGSNSAAWPTIFNNQPNDAIVPETSELDGVNPDFAFVFQGFVHSEGVEKLGFSGPSVLDAAPFNPIPTMVITLLNTPVNTPGDFNLVDP